MAAFITTTAVPSCCMRACGELAATPAAAGSRTTTFVGILWATCTVQQLHLIVRKLLADTMSA